MFFSKKSTESDDTGTGVAMLERDDEPGAGAAIDDTRALVAPVAPGKPKSRGDDEPEYEWELETPFGKLELEIEPRERKEEKERRKREKQEREAAKQAAKLAKKAERARALAAKQGAAAGEVVVVRGSNLVPILVVFAIILAALAIAYWLFARPDEEEDEIPPELRTDESLAAAAQPQGLAARLKQAIRAGRQASREAQAEQQRRFEEATKQG